MIPHRLQRLLESRDLEATPTTDEEVTAYWRKSLRAFRDSYVPGLSPEGAFARAYQSALDEADEEERTKEHLESLQDTLTHFLPAAHRWLTAQRPGLKDELQSPSDISPAG